MSITSRNAWKLCVSIMFLGLNPSKPVYVTVIFQNILLLESRVTSYRCRIAHDKIGFPTFSVV